METKKISKNTEFFKIVGRYYLKQWKLTILVIKYGFAFCINKTNDSNINTTNDNEYYYEANKLLDNATLPLQGFWGLHWNASIFIALGVVLTDLFATFLFNFFGYLIKKK